MMRDSKARAEIAQLQSDLIAARNDANANLALFTGQARRTRDLEIKVEQLARFVGAEFYVEPEKPAVPAIPAVPAQVALRKVKK